MSRTGGMYKQIVGKIKRETHLAICVEVESISGIPLEEAEKQEHWFPLSQIKSILRAAPDTDQLDVLYASEWILRQKELL